jgi:hypothetical protein
LASKSEDKMNRLFFHFWSRQRLIRDTEGRQVGDLAAAHRHAMLLIHKAAVLLDDADWRGWSVKVTDGTGRSVLNVLFPRQPYFRTGRSAERPHRGTAH